MLDENRLQQQSLLGVSGAAHYDALGRICTALDEAGVEPTFTYAFAMLELAFLNLRAAGVPPKGVQAIVGAIESLYEGGAGLDGSSRAH